MKTIWVWGQAKEDTIIYGTGDMVFELVKGYSYRIITDGSKIFLFPPREFNCHPIGLKLATLWDEYTPQWYENNKEFFDEYFVNGKKVYNKLLEESKKLYD